MNRQTTLRIAATLASHYVLAPAVLFAFLTSPHVYLALQAPDAFTTQFTSGYNTINFLLIFLLLGLFFTARAFVPRTSTTVFWVILNMLFLVAALEVGITLMAGLGFSPEFFVHFEWESVKIAFVDHWPKLLLTAAGLIAGNLLLWAVFHLTARTTYRRLIVVVSVVLAIRSGYVLYRAVETRFFGVTRSIPVASLLFQAKMFYGEGEQHRHLVLDPNELALLAKDGIRWRPTELPATQATPRYNLIWIYLESFQTNYISAGDSPFPGLTPNLDRYLPRMTWVSNYLNSTYGTINALVVSHCGFHVQLNGETIQAYNGALFHKIVCLSDILRAAGYRLEYAGGEGATFSGKGAFLRGHGYERTYGLSDWMHNPEYAARRGASWGLHDTDLMRESLKIIDRLREHPPFAYTVATLDSHMPGWPSPDCPVYREGKSMLNGIHCTDQAVGAFLDGLQQRGLFDNSVIIVMGDHMVLPSADADRALGRDAAPSFVGHTFLALHVPGNALPRRIDTPTYTPDIPPTILDLLHLHGSSWLFGRSLVNDRARYPHLIAPLYDFFDGKLVPYPVRNPELDCSWEAEQAARITTVDRPLTSCERGRLAAAVSTLLYSAAMGSPTTATR